MLFADLFESVGGSLCFFFFIIAWVIWGIMRSVRDAAKAISKNKAATEFGKGFVEGYVEALFRGWFGGR